MARRTVPPRLILAAAAALVAVALTAPVPVLDEESYLALGAQLDPLRPYDWWRPWPPWGGGREADAYVYAHPPGFLWWTWLWLQGFGAVGAPVGMIKAVAGLPWALLLGWCAGRLAERCCQHSLVAAGAFLTTPVVVLGLQRGLMPDLPLAALMAYSVVAWLEADTASSEERARPWYLGSAVALALAGWIKYPAALLLLALLVHAWARRGLRRALPFWLAWSGLLVLGEAWLALQYGRLHLWEVLSRAEEIPRGSLDGRLLGVLARLPFVVAALALVGRRWSSTWAVSAAGALLLAGVVPPEDTGGGARLAVAAFATVGLVGLVAAARAVAEGVPLGLDEPSSTLRTDGLLLGAWALAWVGGVILVHNFAAPRYLLPAALPLLLLVVRATELRRGSRRWLHLVVALQALLALALTWTERRHATAAVDLAQAALIRYPAGGLYTGEWAFRWRMEQAGWVFFTGEAREGVVVLAPRNHAPGPLPAGWTRLESLEARDDWPLRVVDGARGIGFYGETLGLLPLGWSTGPLETVDIWKVSEELGP